MPTSRIPPSRAGQRIRSEMKVRDDQHREIDHDADGDHVEDRADPQALPEWKPGAQYQESDEDSDGADRDPDPVRDPLVEDFPGTQPEVGFDHQGKPEPNDDQTRTSVGGAAGAARHGER